MQKKYSFNDVLLVPQYSDISTRSNVSVSTSLGKDVNLTLPIISSPMDTVTSNLMATMMSRNGGMGIVHRYNSPEEQANLVFKAASNSDFVGAAIGVSGDFVERAVQCRSAGAKVICIDVAHGHHISVKNAIRKLRDRFGDSIHIMAGNVATSYGFSALESWGADSIRVGIGGGSICSTRVETGHGIPTLSSIFDCASVKRNATLIADGGIRTSGDIVKAIAAGADAVMLGSMIAGTDECPGDFTFIHGKKVKKYRGMASEEAQLDWRGHYSSSEGVSRLIEHKGSVNKILQHITRSVKSGLSYSGCTNIEDFQEVAEFILQSPSSQIESSTHIDKI